MKLGKIKEVAALNPRKFRIFHRHLLKGNIHTQFVTQNVKMTFSVQPTNAPLKTSCVTYYTMKTLFDQNRKYCNQKNKILHLVSHIVLQAVSLIGTTEPSTSVPGGSDRHALL